MTVATQVHSPAALRNPCRTAAASLLSDRCWYSLLNRPPPPYTPPPPPPPPPPSLTNPLSSRRLKVTVTFFFSLLASLHPLQLRFIFAEVCLSSWPIGPHGGVPAGEVIIYIDVRVTCNELLMQQTPSEVWKNNFRDIWHDDNWAGKAIL